jgi:hypothetical protein
MKGQTVFLSERCAELMHENLITDRTVIDVMAFTSAAKSIKEADKISYEEYARNFINEYDYIFYVSPEGVEIEDNNVRETNAEYRDLIDFIIKDICKNYNHRIKNSHTLSGTTEERIKQILEVISL